MCLQFPNDLIDDASRGQTLVLNTHNWWFGWGAAQLRSSLVNLVSILETYLERNMTASSTTDPSGCQRFLTVPLYKPIWRSTPNIYLKATSLPSKVCFGKWTHRWTMMVKNEGGNIFSNLQRIIIMSNCMSFNSSTFNVFAHIFWKNLHNSIRVTRICFIK